MKKLFDSCDGVGRAFAWTVFYVFLMWVILYYLFNFNMFLCAHWVRLARVELHGFPGLVFGILILAAVPLYVATTVLTMRNKSVPVKIPLPKCFEPVAKPPEPAPVPVVTEQEKLPELHPGVPAEMRESFMRARKNYGVRQRSVFNKPMTISAVGVATDTGVPMPELVASTPVVHNMATEMSNDTSVVDVADATFPIPTDFDVESSTDADYEVPVFSDINFDNDADSDSENNTVGDDLCEFLGQAGYSAHKTDDDLIFVNNFIIAVHDDDDFWVADDMDWFAAGKQKTSPIAALNVARTNNNALHPVLYLGAQNIMDVDAKIEKWRTDGIMVITDRDELLNIVQNFAE